VLSLPLLIGCELSTFETGLSIGWDVPVERENGEQLFLYEIGGYEIAYREIGSNTYTTLIIENGDITQATISELIPGQYEFRIAAFDSNGLYSRYSEPVVLSTSGM
jgi:hypothetical protein